jgi:hypothetical protein
MPWSVEKTRTQNTPSQADQHQHLRQQKRHHLRHHIANHGASRSLFGSPKPCS